MKNRLEVVMYDGGGRQVERKVNAINRALSILRLILQDEHFWLWSKPDGEWYEEKVQKGSLREPNKKQQQQQREQQQQQQPPGIQKKSPTTWWWTR